MGTGFDQIREGLEEAIAYAKGDGSKGRAHAPAPDVREIRGRLGLSQSEFAALFGVSLPAIKKWEQGQRVPRGPAASLMRVIAAEPEAVVRALRQPIAAKRASTRARSLGATRGHDGACPSKGGARGLSRACACTRPPCRPARACR